MIVGVCDALVGHGLIGGISAFVGMAQGGVVVLMNVMVGLMLELAQQPARVQVRHVPVAMRMNLRRMGMLPCALSDPLILRSHLRL